MAMTLRLSDAEVERLRARTSALNIELVKKHLEPMRLSSLLHLIIDIGTEHMYIDDSGRIRVREPKE